MTRPGKGGDGLRWAMRRRESGHRRAGELGLVRLKPLALKTALGEGGGHGESPQPEPGQRFVELGVGVRKEGNCPRLLGGGRGSGGLLLPPERRLGVGVCLGNRGSPASPAPAGGCLFIVRFLRDAAWAASLALNLETEKIKNQIFRVADAKLALCARSMAGLPSGMEENVLQKRVCSWLGRAILGSGHFSEEIQLEQSQRVL